MRRRDFIKVIAGSVAAWPLAGQAQQPAVPVVGYLNLGGSPESDSSRLTGLRRGLNQTGYVEGRNLLIEYRGLARYGALSTHTCMYRKPHPICFDNRIA
jgi:putative ABC transport system substrate-binding protein